MRRARGGIIFCHSYQISDYKFSNIPNSSLFMEREQTLLDIWFTGMREQLVANACNFCFQLCHIQFLFADDNGFAIFCGRSHFLHREQIANQVIHMRFAHSAHHAINFQYCFYHFKTQLSFAFLFPLAGVCPLHIEDNTPSGYLDYRPEWGILSSGF